MKDFFENNADKYCALWFNTCSLSNIDYLLYAKNIIFLRELYIVIMRQMVEILFKKSTSQISSKEKYLSMQQIFGLVIRILIYGSLEKLVKNFQIIELFIMRLI